MRCGYGLQQKEVKFLGVVIDENLDFKLQVTNVKKKTSKGNYVLLRYRSKFQTTLKKIMRALRERTAPYLSVCGAKKTNTLTELQKLIKKIW